MIAVDTSTLIAYFSGLAGGDVDALDDALLAGTAVLPPPVLSELLSDPELPPALEVDVRRIPVLPIVDGFWERVGTLRRAVLKRGLRARLADALIAQCCLDHRLALIARDRDFRNYAAVSPLRVI